MKNIITRILALLMLVCMGIPSSRANGPTSYSHQMSFSLSALNIVEEEHQGQIYTVIQMEGMQNRAEIGEPELPVYGFNISVPQYADSFDIVVAVNEMKNIKLDYLPLPAQSPRTTGYYEEYDNRFDIPKDNVYSGIALYPATNAELGESNLVKGFNRIVSVFVHPVTWDPTSNQLSLATEMTVTVSWIINQSEDKEKQILMPKYQDLVNAGLETTREMVVNPEDVDRWFENGQILRATALNSSTAHPTYAVITPKAFAESANRLAAIRKVRGINPIVVYLEDILSDPLYSLGDHVSALNDDAGKLRGYLQHAYTDLGITDVLLLGDYPIMPGRRVRYDHSANKIKKYISDLYFCNLTGKWTLNAEGYQVINDLQYAGYELNVGRIPGRNSYEFDNYIDKLLQYEYNIYNADRSYLNNAFVFCGSDPGLDDSYKIQRPIYNSLFDLTELITSQSGNQLGAQIIEKMNTGQYGYVDFLAHGDYYGFTSYDESSDDGTIFYGVTSYDHIDKANNYQIGFQPEENNGLDCWKNLHFPNWSISMSCTLAEMGHARDEYNFVRSYLMSRDYGGVMFIGNTEASYFGYVDVIINNIFTGIRKNYNANRICYPGVSMTEGKKLYSNYFDLRKHSLAIMTLFGDPMMPLWISSPLKSHLENGNFLAEGLDDNQEVEVGDYDFDNGTSTTYKATLREVKNLSPVENSTLMFYRHDMEPFIHPVTIKDMMLDRDDYWFMKDLKIIPSSTSYESLSVAATRNLFIDAMGDIEIIGGLMADKEGTLSLHGHHQIQCDGTIYPGEGAIVLEAQERTILLPGFEVKEGAHIEIK